MSTDPIALCAAGEAAWHQAAYAGLGATWHHDAAIAWGPVVPHRYLLAAVTLAPRPVLPPGLRGIVRDCWASLGPGDLPGWTAEPDDPWMLRPRGSIAAQAIPGVTVAPTTDALLFEDTAFRAAGGTAPGRPGELHPAGSAAQPGLTLLLAWRAGQPVGTALAVRHRDGVVVSGVAVLAAERGRGIGAALTAAAAATAPGLPATLTASVLGLGVYRRLGFRELARPVHWHPPVTG